MMSSPPSATVVSKHMGIDVHRHIHREKPAAEFADFVLSNDTNALECRRIIPLAIVKSHQPEIAAAFLQGDFEALKNCRLAHRGMIAESNHHSQSADLPTQMRMDSLEEIPPPDTSGSNRERSVRHVLRENLPKGSPG